MSKNSNNTTKEESSSNTQQPLYSGRWTREEEDYTNALIYAFRAGILPDVEEGATMRSFLADAVACDPKRISKKYEGTDYQGRAPFWRNNQYMPEKEKQEQLERLGLLKERFEKSRQNIIDGVKPPKKCLRPSFLVEQMMKVHRPEPEEEEKTTLVPDRHLTPKLANPVPLTRGELCLLGVHGFNMPSPQKREASFNPVRASAHAHRAAEFAFCTVGSPARNRPGGTISSNLTTPLSGVVARGSSAATTTASVARWFSSSGTAPRGLGGLMLPSATQNAPHQARNAPLTASISPQQGLFAATGTGALLQASGESQDLQQRLNLQIERALALPRTFRGEAPSLFHPYPHAASAVLSPTAAMQLLNIPRTEENERRKRELLLGAFGLNGGGDAAFQQSSSNKRPRHY